MDEGLAGDIATGIIGVGPPIKGDGYRAGASQGSQATVEGSSAGGNTGGGTGGHCRRRGDNIFISPNVISSTLRSGSSDIVVVDGACSRTRIYRWRIRLEWQNWYGGFINSGVDKTGLVPYNTTTCRIEIPERQ